MGLTPERKKQLFDKLTQLEGMLQGVDGGKEITPYTEPQSFEELSKRPDERPEFARMPDFRTPQRVPTFGSALYKATGLPQPEAIQKLQRGIGQQREGNWGAGIPNIILNAPTTQAFSPMQGLNELVQMMPEDPMNPQITAIKALVSATNYPFQKLGEGFQYLSDVALDANRKNLGLNERQFQELKESSGEASANIGTTALTAGIGKGVGGVKRFATGRPVRVTKSADIDFDRALPTVTKELTRSQDRGRLAPYLVEEHKISPLKTGNRDNSAMRQLAEEKIPNIKNRIYSEQDVLIQRNKDVPIVGGVESIAQNIESLRNIYTKNIDVLKDASILDEANKYRKLKSITLSQARELQRSLNASLQEFYKKSSEGQAAAENMARPIAEMEKSAQALREQIVKTLNFVGEDGKWYREKSLDYGAAVKLEVAAERNITKAEAPLPPFFTTTQSSFYPSRPGVVREIGEHTIGRFYTPDKLIVRSMEKYGKAGLSPPKGVPQRGWKNVRGLLPPPSTKIAPEYLSEAQGYPSSAPQQADVMQVKVGKFAIDQNKLKSIVESGGGKFRGISDMGKAGYFVWFDEPSGSTLGLLLKDLTPEAVKAKVRGYGKK